MEGIYYSCTLLVMKGCLAGTASEPRLGLVSRKELPETMQCRQLSENLACVPVPVLLGKIRVLVQGLSFIRLPNKYFSNPVHCGS